MVAEGVETAEQVKRLKQIGCDYVQGYYFSRPVPAGEVLTMHRRAAMQLVHGGLSG